MKVTKVTSKEARQIAGVLGKIISGEQTVTTKFGKPLQFTVNTGL